MERASKISDVDSGVGLAAQRDLLLLGAHGERLQGVRDEIGHRVRLPLQLHAPRIQLRQHEEIVHEVRESGEVPLGGAQVSRHRLGIVDDAVRERLDDDAHRRQRGAQIVTDRGQEIATRGLDLKARPLGLPQPTGHLVEARRESGDLVGALHRDLDVEIAAGHLSCRAVQPARSPRRTLPEIR